MDIILPCLKEDDILEKTFRQYEKKEDYVCDNGKVYMEPTHLIVGRRYDFTITYLPFELIPEGGKIKFAIPKTWSRPQLENPGISGYVEGFINSERCRDIEISYTKNLEWYITLRLHRDISPGDKIIVKYNRVQIQKFPQDKWENWRNNLSVFVSRDNIGWFPVAPENKHNLPIISPEEFSTIRITIPSFTKPSVPFKIKISFLDKYNNPVKIKGKISLPSIGKDFNIDNKDHYECEGIFKEEGIWNIEVVYNNSKFESNYSICDANNKLNLYFGDIHAKTNISDGLGSPDEYFYHARYISHDDFSAIADHNHRECASVYEPWIRKMKKEQLNRIMESVEKNNSEGEFVTIPAEEEALPGYGHRNVYYKVPPKEIFMGTTPEGLYDFLKTNNIEALVIPHHTLELCKSTYYEPEFTPLIEIYSMWGSSEERGNILWNKNEHNGKSVIEILNEGHILGFIGGSDNHNGQPGISAMPSRFSNLCYRGGLAAVFSERLTREDIFNGLKTRYCYATTGARIILLFFLNNRRMGEMVEVSQEEEIKIKVKVIGTSSLRKLEIIRNGKITARYEVNEDSFIADITYIEKEKLEGSFYYYVKVVQDDFHIAWSSPIWVNVKRR